MTFNIIQTLNSSQTVRDEIPLKDDEIEVVRRGNKSISDMQQGNSDRFFVFMGPCSAWPFDAVYEFYEQLKSTIEQVSDKIDFFGRVYTQKPRTVGGWPGPLIKPDPFGNEDANKGIRECRGLMKKVLGLGLPIIDEALYTHNHGYFDDALSALALGARSSEDQEHRYWLSGLSHPILVKHPTSGEIQKGINSILAINSPHIFSYKGDLVQTYGNKNTSLLLRGGSTTGPNYQSAQEALDMMRQKGIENPTVIVDCSHDNTLYNGKKDYKRQTQIAQEVDLKYVSGIMVEAFLKEGNCSPKSVVEYQANRGRSITDGCIGIEDSKNLLLNLRERL